ncbi:MAG: hypothetical protein AB1798_08480 [Spirochaetota bacterium]
MDQIELNELKKQDLPAGKAKNMTLLLDSLENTRADLADTMRRFLQGEITDNKYRCLIYGFNSLVKLLTHLKVGELERRIKALEDQQKGVYP